MSGHGIRQKDINDELNPLMDVIRETPLPAQDFSERIMRRIAVGETGNMQMGMARAGKMEGHLDGLMEGEIEEQLEGQLEGQVEGQWDGQRNGQPGRELAVRQAVVRQSRKRYYLFGMIAAVLLAGSVASAAILNSKSPVVLRGSDGEVTYTIHSVVEKDSEHELVRAILDKLSQDIPPGYTIRLILGKELTPFNFRSIGVTTHLTFESYEELLASDIYYKPSGKPAARLGEFKLSSVQLMLASDSTILDIIEKGGQTVTETDPESGQAYTYTMTKEPVKATNAVYNYEDGNRKVSYSFKVEDIVNEIPKEFRNIFVENLSEDDVVLLAGSQGYYGQAPENNYFYWEDRKERTRTVLNVTSMTLSKEEMIEFAHAALKHHLTN